MRVSFHLFTDPEWRIIIEMYKLLSNAPKIRFVKDAYTNYIMVSKTNDKDIKQIYHVTQAL